MLRFEPEKRDRYRPLFCTSDFYLKNQNIFKLWKTRFSHLSNVEKVQAWVIGLSCLRRPKDWFGGLRPIPLVLVNERLQLEARTLKFTDLIADTPIYLPSRLSPELSLGQILATCKVKPLPESCLRSLFLFSDPEYPLVILNHVPTPRELLDFQLLSKRVITFNENYEDWPTSLSGGRDFLSFIIHDLIHADHFLNDNKNNKGQLGFYHFIESIWFDEALQALLLSSEFKDGFDYIISDMNSHPVHLLKTLHALLFRTTCTRKHAKEIWFNWSLTWSRSALIEETGDQSIDALQKINTQLFSDMDALKLESMCFKNGQKKHLESQPELR